MVEEKIFLGLRSVVGIEERILDSGMKERAQLLKREGKLTCRNGRYFNPNYLLSDEIALFIIG